MDAFEHPLKFSIQNHYREIFYHEDTKARSYTKKYTHRKDLRETLCPRAFVANSLKV